MTCWWMANTQVSIQVWEVLCGATLSSLVPKQPGYKAISFSTCLHGLCGLSIGADRVLVEHHVLGDDCHHLLLSVQ